ncbi:MAG: phenylalanine--tRNA ligase subunit beta [Pelagibacteraceae bacterium TMED237]|nr:MAG: phenylalanine--tRNA ligase subunit beta [Pelagibacteraceae bacterium TMED237]|tara:strand:+ start:7940 stop:10330 length:2391 start_codon:yes stop_codon:yes gene_type:complete
MKFTLDWLKDHLETSNDLKTITDTLTNIGLEIERVEDKSQDFKNFTVAKVIKSEKHPDADKLKVCEVKTINGNFQVVCGAPNAREGMLGIFAPENSYIPGTDLHLKKTKIRGVESCGMLVSEREMGISDEHDGIIEIKDDYKIGDSFSKIFKLDEPIIEINLTPNRSDCLSVRGIARDLAAAGVGKLKELKFKKIKDSFKSPMKWKKEFKDNKLCPGVAGRYFKNVKNVESPKWLQQRLTAIGLRPISALVDITNYVTFDLGRPLHVYDADKVSGNLTMRLAKNKEECMALNEVNYKCDEEMIVISDDEKKLHGIGGVMGGLNSGCSMDTKNVFLEVALFDPISVTKTGRKLNLQSDARYRFERGIDTESIYWGVEAASQMISELCGGEASEYVSSETHINKREMIFFNTNMVKTFGGIEIEIKEQSKILKSLGFNVKELKSKLEIEIPTFRPDIYGEADIVEEIIRIYGFDKIPLKSINYNEDKKEILNNYIKIFYKIKRIIASKGYSEVVTWSFMDENKAKIISNELIHLKNPISSDLNTMRPSTIPNLLEAVNQNKARLYLNAKIFEVGPNFSKSFSNLQENVATSIAYGLIEEPNWLSNKKNNDVFSIKADLFSILTNINVPTENLLYEKIDGQIYHPGKSSSLRLGKNKIANFGEIHPILLKNMDINFKVYAFEIYIENIAQFQENKSSSRNAFLNNPYQMVERDFAFLFPKQIKANEIIKKVKKVDKNLIQRVTIFDLYQGDKLPNDKKSIAFRVLMQPQDKTFNDQEIENLSKQIIDVISKSFEASIRN